MGVLHLVGSFNAVNYFQENSACRTTFPVFWDPPVKNTGRKEQRQQYREKGERREKRTDKGKGHRS